MTQDPRLVMLLGSPRSGTTWLQSLLGAHSDIATPQETDLFRVYLEPLVDAWSKQRRGLDDVEARRRKGLPLVLTESEFDAAVGTLLRATLRAVERMKPSATVVLEKSPSHSLCVDTILRFAPDARFLHIVRDGRDVVSSLIAASGSWGARWAPSTVARSARVWRTHVLGAREAARCGAYHEVRYEALREPAGVSLLRDVFEFVGVDISETQAASFMEEQSFERASGRGVVSASILTGGEGASSAAARHEPEGFFRQGAVGGWRAEWSADDKRAFNEVAGDLLIELGYERDSKWVGSHPRPRLATRVKHRAANTTAKALRSIAERVERVPR